ncbi:MAG TPA: hypothetical protein VHL98_19220 [Microvirga sp.]|jgi:hypothetical protein|nr:hypothetical protein [Microvirga sp.]
MRADARIRLFAMHVELFVNAPSRDRETVRAFEALALGFMPRLDAATLASAARLLAPCNDTPASVLAYLFQRSADTRDAVLDLAPTLPPLVADLMIGTGRAAGLAARPGLDAWTQDRLLVMEDPVVDARLAANPHITLTETVLRRLIARAAERPALARTLLAREDIALADEAALYLAADAGRRLLIRERIEASATFQRRSLVRLPQAEAVALAARAAEGDVAAFEAALSQAFGLAGAPPWRLLRPERQDLLALALAALGIEEQAAMRIFLTLHPVVAHPVRSVFRLAESFRSVPQATARVLVEAILGADAERHEWRSGQHVPMFEATGTAVRPGVPAPAEQPQREEPRRLVG